jgi:hypothetical protein
VSCHNPDQRDGGIDLCGDHTPKFSVSYWTIYRHRLVADGWNLPKSNYPPREIGTSASPLMDYLEPAHHNVRLTEREKDTVRWWIESSAVYPGTYAALGSGMVNARLYARDMNRRCRECHAAEIYDKKRRRMVPSWRFGTPTDRERKTTSLAALVNLTRPDKSVLLMAPLAREAGGLQLCGDAIFADRTDPLYLALHEQLQQAGTQLDEIKRFDMPGFRPNDEYIREMKRFGILPTDLAPHDPLDPYQVDEQYWQSFWYHLPRDRDAMPSE